MKQEEPYDVGVLVGRFQEHELHEAHRDLIEYVKERHDKVVVLLGLAPVFGRRNPLDFQARKQMLLDYDKDLIVAFVKDVGSDELWSKRLDQQIQNFLTPGQSVVLYGGRDSFMRHYSGKHPTRELTQEKWISAEAIRKQIARSSTIASADFRAGVIWAAYSRFPTSFQTVDVVVFDERKEMILLGKRDYEPAYRVFGGFVDPSDPSLEHAAIRELKEEAGITVEYPKYAGSHRIDDWRYRQEPDKILTALFTAVYKSGTPEPGDDIDEVRWFDVPKFGSRLLNDVMPQHHALIHLALSTRSA